MAEHTPGPWITKYDPSTHRIEINAEHDGRCVSFIHVPPATGYTVCEANARLIASAPDLLEALEAAIASGMIPKSSAKEGGANKYSENVRIADQCRAAIAKARGQS